MNVSSSNSPYPPTSPAAVTSSNAIISLICGVLAWLGVFGLGGILAVIFGHVAKNEIRRNSDRITGDGMATAGLVLGYANIALTLMGVCLVFLMIAGLIGTPLICAPFLNQMNTSFSTIP
jgi:hypothetical protein